VPIVLKMIEEGQCEASIKVSKGESGGRFTNVPLGKLEEQPEAVSIRGNCARADGSMASQMLDEEVL
jgi:hypothetical protein